jgi:Ser/Thr protein kinase RdoA (MazF antagonist)
VPPAGGPPRAYEDLTPLAVLEALDACGLRGDGRLLQLNSYENRVFQVFLEDGSAVVAKFYRPGRWSDAQILEEHAFAQELAEAEVPVVAPLQLLAGDDIEICSGDVGSLPTLARWRDGRSAHRWSVSPRRSGREPELEQLSTLEVLGRFLGRLHAVGRRQPFRHRRQMRPGDDARQAIQTLAAQDCIPATQADAWHVLARQAADAIAAAFEAPAASLRLHGDCHLGNVLWRDGLPHIVDLDDACTGPAVQDLWMLVSGDAQTLPAQLRALLSGYELFADFDDGELRLIEPLRTLRMLRHCAWIAERWQDPTFPIHFPYFRDAAWWSQQTTQLREQLQVMHDAAA